MQGPEASSPCAASSGSVWYEGTRAVAPSATGFVKLLVAGALRE